MATFKALLGMACLMGSGLACAHPNPQAADVQRAYEAARTDADSNPLHRYDLAIKAAKCSALPQGQAEMCQIDFVRQDQPDGRLYFEVVTMAWRQGAWVLLSGLCKTKSPSK